MYQIKQTYINYKQPGRNFVRCLKKSYKTFKGAEKAARAYRYSCRPDLEVTEESWAEVVGDGC